MCNTLKSLRACIVIVLFCSLVGAQSTNSTQSPVVPPVAHNQLIELHMNMPRRGKIPIRRIHHPDLRRHTIDRRDFSVDDPPAGISSLSNAYTGSVVLP
jgi:hypothetical protein